MAIPSGGGTEVLKSNRILALSDDWVDLIPASDITETTIITIISIICTSQEPSVVASMNLATFDYNGSAYSNESRFLYAQLIPTREVFVWNDRMVLYSGSSSTRKILRGLTDADLSSGGVDVFTSYIKQDWT